MYYKNEFIHYFKARKNIMTKNYLEIPEELYNKLSDYAENDQLSIRLENQQILLENPKINHTNKQNLALHFSIWNNCIAYLFKYQSSTNRIYGEPPPLCCKFEHNSINSFWFFWFHMDLSSQKL